MIEVKDLFKFIDYLRKHDYTVEEGAHSVLLDHSELADYKILKNNSIHGLMVAHYITQYYRVEALNINDNDEYLRELLKVKHSGEKWAIPVNPVIIIDLSNELINVVSNYVDEYPVEDGEELVRNYRSRNPRYESIPRILLAKLLDELRRGS